MSSGWWSAGGAEITCEDIYYCTSFNGSACCVCCYCVVCVCVCVLWCSYSALHFTVMRWHSIVNSGGSCSLSLPPSRGITATSKEMVGYTFCLLITHLETLPLPLLSFLSLPPSPSSPHSSLTSSSPSPAAILRWMASQRRKLST